MTSKHPFLISAGFTLVELLVSVTVFVLVTTIAVSNNNQFNSSVILTNLAYEIALSVRQAQTFGISIKQKATSGSTYTDVFNSGFGVHFDKNTAQYIFFEDKAADPSDPSSVPNSKYDSGEALDIYNIKKGNKIGKICLGGGACSDSSYVDVSFKRPNPDAIITSGGTSYAKAEVCVVSAAGVNRKIVIEVTGQISVVTDSAGIAVCN